MTRSVTGNRILDSIPDSEFAALAAWLRPSTLKSGEILYQPHERTARIYFPTGCVLSVITIMQDGGAVEIGTVGREGMSGAHIILGAQHMPSQMVCQVPGDTLSMSIEEFERALETGPSLRSFARRYTRALYNFMGQSVACNRLHELEERCARWLALTHDRVDSDEFSLTQEFLAIMLGVHRPSVSIAAGALQQAGFIRYSRGRVVVTDRVGLEDVACECYRFGANEFEKALSPE